jgi:molecular chaperone Hsp33
MMLHRMAEPGMQRQSGEGDGEREDAWRRAVILMGSSTSDELLDPDLHPHRLLYRLFHEDGVRVFAPSPLAMRCRCSRARVARVLKSFPRNEIEDMKTDDGRVQVICEFCNSEYLFDDADLADVYGRGAE